MKPPADSFLFFFDIDKMSYQTTEALETGWHDWRPCHLLMPKNRKSTNITTCVSSTEMDVALLELSEQYKLVQFSVIFFCVLQCLTETVQ